MQLLSQFPIQTSIKSLLSTYIKLQIEEFNAKYETLITSKVEIITNESPIHKPTNQFELPFRSSN